MVVPNQVSSSLSIDASLLQLHILIETFSSVLLCGIRESSCFRTIQQCAHNHSISKSDTRYITDIFYIF